MSGIAPETIPGWSDADCGPCSDCVDSCPGLDPETPKSELELFGRTRSQDERWVGIIREVYAGHATDMTVLRNSASGGSATVLLRSAMELLELDCVLVAGRDPDRGWLAQTAVCRHWSDLESHMQSTYQLFPHLSTLREILSRPEIRRIGLVGLACHIQAVRKMQRLPGEWGRAVSERVKFLLETACSSSTRPSGTETLIQDHFDVPLEAVADVRFRDGEYPGQVAVKLKSGDVRTLPFWKAVRHFKDHKTHRCLVCGDWMSGLADLSICDADPNIFHSSQYGAAYEKRGLILVRTDQGARVLRSAVERNLLRCTSATLPEVNLGLDRKRNRRAFYERGGADLSAPPIAGYVEPEEPIPDERLIPEIAVSAIAAAHGD